MTEAVLVMAYGTPTGLDDVEAYYTDIRRGRPPSPEQLEELTERYRAIGGRSPLLEITESQARGIGERAGVPAYVGQKHAAPFIPDAIARMKRDGITRAVGLVLAPHYSTMSIGDYARRVTKASEATSWAGTVEMIDSWHTEPAFIDLLARYCTDAAGTLPVPVEETTFLFTAHSLPSSIVAQGDPYPDQLRETAEAVASTLGIARWRVGWQSAGRTEQEWLGPDVLDIMQELADDGAPAVVVCACGFVADHLEVLYDLDIEAAQHAAGLGIAFARTRSPNDDPAFLDMLGEVVSRAIRPA